jgi:hypothetical protein
MESNQRSLTPSEYAPSSNLVSDSRSDDAVRQDLSDSGSESPSPTLTQAVAPPPSQPDASSMSGESPTQTHLLSNAVPDSPRDTLPSEPSQSEHITSIFDEDHTSSSIPTSVDSTFLASSSSGDSSYGMASFEGLSATSSTLYASETCPHLIPLPESDVEDEESSDFPPFERVRRTFGPEHQGRGAYTNPIDERTNSPTRSSVHNTTQPSTQFSLR